MRGLEKCRNSERLRTYCKKLATIHMGGQKKEYLAVEGGDGERGTGAGGKGAVGESRGGAFEEQKTVGELLKNSPQTNVIRNGSIKIPVKNPQQEIKGRVSQTPLLCRGSKDVCRKGGGPFPCLRGVDTWGPLTVPWEEVRPAGPKRLLDGVGWGILPNLIEIVLEENSIHKNYM